MLGPTHSGIDYYQSLRPGSHLCQFYNNTQEYFEVLIPFFQAGLKANQFCFWVLRNHAEEIRAYKALHKVVPNLNDYVKKGQIVIAPRSKWYQGPVSEFHKKLPDWLEQLEERAQGFEAIRGSGEVGWLKNKEWDDFIRYENSLDEIIPSRKLISLCSYPLKNLMASDVTDVIHAHPQALIKKKNRWMVTKARALTENEATYRRIFDQALEGIFQTTADGKYISVNPAMARMLGYSSPESLMEEIRDIAGQIYVIPEQREVWKRLVEQKGTLRDFQQELYRKDGSRIWVSFCARAVRDEKSKLLYYEGSVQDITDRKLAEEERKELLLQLKKKNENLEMLSRQIVSIQEKERRHIARELHDEIGQLLTGLRLKLEAALRLPVEPISNALQEMDMLFEELIGRLRELSLELCPAILDDLGLLPAILWHLERFTNQTGIQVDFKHSQLSNVRFRQDVENAAYRILQEALTNVTRHAGRCEVRVRIWIVSDTLHLEIQDNGKGFDLNSIHEKNATFGLSGMQERAAILHGTFVIKSASRKGTSISVQLPLIPD
jgi:PAS domain S-box-containing protein